ncbi:MAG: hypothetical protein R3C14_01220 [Caldilineaceae bacterium]
MNLQQVTPDWHKRSYDHFLQERLPQLLADRLPLAGYEAAATAAYVCRITVTLEGAAGGTTVTFADLPYPDNDGLFNLQGEMRTVVPWVAHSDLATAPVKCVGDLLYEWIAEQLGEAPADLPWDEALLRAWLPLDKWLYEFMQTHRHAQLLDVTNWLARQCHARRIIIDQRTSLTTASQFGRVDPFEIPEGPNMGRIFALALGATICDGAIVIEDDRPEAMLGVTSSMIPCLEHDDPNRLLMGANMMRQWLPYSEPEPALVQTGNEPNAPHFWCGRNLLTAFIPWGEDTFEDAIVLSASAARRLSNLQHTQIPWFGAEPFDLYHEVEPGDKLSNRHGAKGVVSRIVPDAQMPHLADGTPIELIVSSLRLPGRMNVGQLWEAVLGRLARHEGAPIIAPPFHGPDEATIRQRLTTAALPEDGLETLHSGRGNPLSHPSLVGWVYWGRTHHLSRDKLFYTVDHAQQGQRIGDLEVSALRSVGAVETLREHFLTRATPAAPVAAPQPSLVEQFAIGPVAQASAPTPCLVQLQQRLAAAGIQATLAANNLRFAFAPVAGESIQLAQPVPHPWLPEQQLTELGALSVTEGDDDPATRQLMQAYGALQQVNAKLARLLASHAPESLVQQAYGQLVESVHRYLNGLLLPGDLRLAGRALFTGRAVLAPAPGLEHDRIGLPEEMAWAYFGPQAARTLDTEAVAQRTEEAAELLDEILADAWVVLHSAPATEPTAFLAFRPLRIPERVVRLPSLACPLLGADFDGDQIAIHVPITAAGQQEAAERLSLAAHLSRDPSLVDRLTKQDEAIWGLAYLSLTEAGRAQIAQAAGVEIAMPAGFLTRPALVQAMQALLAEQGAAATLTHLRNLVQLGFAVGSGSGFSMSPFVGDSVERLPITEDTDPTTAAVAQTQLAERILAATDFGRDVGPYVLGVKSGANPEAHLRALTYILGVSRVVNDVESQPTIVHNGFRAGLTPADFVKLVPGARAGMGRIWQELEQASAMSGETRAAKSFTVLARARRSSQPGVVFAQAAATGEIDPLTDAESRLFVGLSG